MVESGGCEQDRPEITEKILVRESLEKTRYGLRPRDPRRRFARRGGSEQLNAQKLIADERSPNVEVNGFAEW